MKILYNTLIKVHYLTVARGLGAEMCKEMKTKILKLLPKTFNGPTVEREMNRTEVLETTLRVLKQGAVVGVPTDTVYGLACLAQNSEAIRRTYEIKGRNLQKPLAICVGEVQDIYEYCQVNVKKDLLCDLLPGPVTLVFNRSDLLNSDLNSFTHLVGVRIPNNDFMRRLCQMCKEPLALTSANISSHCSSVEVSEFEDLWSKLSLVVDDGPIGDENRLGSTVVDLSVAGKYRIIRPGCALSATVDVLQRKYGLSEDSATD